jgi:hypothetical protein
MTDSPIDLTIHNHSVPGQIPCVRIEGMDHMRLMVRIDVSPSDFLSAIMGQAVVAAFSRGNGT